MDEEKLFSVLYFPQSKEKAEKKPEKNFIQKEEDLKGFIDFEIERKPQTEDEEVKWPAYMNNYLKKNYALPMPIQKTPIMNHNNNNNNPNNRSLMNQMANNNTQSIQNNSDMPINTLVNIYNTNNNDNNNNNEKNDEESSDSMHYSKDHPIVYTNSLNQLAPALPDHITDNHHLINYSKNSQINNTNNVSPHVNNNFVHSDHFQSYNHHKNEEYTHNNNLYGQNHNFSDGFHPKFSNIHLTKSDSIYSPLFQQLHKIEHINSSSQSGNRKSGYLLHDDMDGEDGADGMNKKQEKNLEGNQQRKKMGLDYLLN